MCDTRRVSATAWLEDLRAAISEYARTRLTTPVVRITLVTGESHFVMRASAGAGDELISLDLYPAGAADLLTIERTDDLGRPEVDTVTPEVMLVPGSSIAKVDILYEHPGEGRFGFQGAD